MGDGGLERLVLVGGMSRKRVDVVRGMAVTGKERHAEGSRYRQRELAWKQRGNVEWTS